MTILSKKKGSGGKNGGGEVDSADHGGNHSMVSHPLVLPHSQVMYILITLLKAVLIYV
jgi:hypothetical protein